MATITASEFSRLNEVRKLQIERYRTAYFKKNGQLPIDTDPFIDPQFLRVKLGMIDCCIPIGLLTKWANTFTETAPLHFDLQPLALRIQRGTSILSVYISNVKHTDKGLEEAVELTVNNHNQIQLNIPDIAAELSTLKSETTTARKQIAKEKAIAKAKKVENETIECLANETQKAEVAQAVLDSMTLEQAIAFAKKCLQTRRIFRSNLNDLKIMPVWFLKTYENEFFNVETQSGGLAIRDTQSDWKEYFEAFDYAEKAQKSYVPRTNWPKYIKWDAEKEGLSLAAYKKAHPELAIPTYGPAFDKLVEATKRAKNNLIQFIRDRFAECLVTQNLPKALSGPLEYGIWGIQDECFQYSRARILLATWPQRKEDLENQLREATAARVACEEK